MLGKTEKLKKARIIFLILMIITAITIFIFSSQDGEKSTATSDGFIKKIVTIIKGENIEEEELQKITDQISFYVRKMAHFTIYTIFGITTYGFINTYKIKLNKKILISLLIGIIYASSDEFHQLFSNGRSASIKDVGIDTLGVIVGILLMHAIYKIIQKVKNKDKNKDKNMDKKI